MIMLGKCPTNCSQTMTVKMQDMLKLNLKFKRFSKLISSVLVAVVPTAETQNTSEKLHTMEPRNSTANQCLGGVTAELHSTEV